MSISFAGLLIPKAIVLNQYGLSLFLGVAFDTFIIRTILMPAIVAAFKVCLYYVIRHAILYSMYYIKYPYHIVYNTPSHKSCMVFIPYHVHTVHNIHLL